MPPKPQSLPRRWLGIVLAIAVLMLGCQAAANLFATPTPEPTSTPRPTATPAATATPRPTATTPPTPTVEAYREGELRYGALLFEDDFSDPSSGWDRYTSAAGNGKTDYLNGEYQILVTAENWILWTNPYRDFTDVVVEVQARWASGGDDNGFGIICRHRDIENWMAIVISSDGYYAFRRRFGGGGLETISGNGSFIRDDRIPTGTRDSITISAVCVEDLFELYVNGVFIDSIVDDSIRTGDVGLMASTFSGNPKTEILFDDFVVFEPVP